VWLVASALMTLACGGSSATAPAVKHVEPAAGALPDDALLLIVGAPSSLVDVRVDRLRGAKLYDRLRPYAQRALCGRGVDLDWLTNAASRALLASREVEARMQWLLVLDGRFTAADGDRLLMAAARQQLNAAIEQQQLGRFSLGKTAGLGASVLDRRYLVLGSAPWVEAAVHSLEHPQPSFATAPLWTSMSAGLACTERALCLVSAGNSRAARELSRIASGAGAAALGQQLGAADSGLAVSLPDGVQLSLRAQMPSRESAQAAIQYAKDWTWQAGLLIKLAALPDVLSGTRWQADGALLRADLDVSASDLAAYEERADQLLGSSASECPPDASAM
jgi:hypothetical protein